MMLDSSPEKLWYYEKYYQKKHQLPHAIVVDENKQLRDGYISYLLAKKYNVRATSFVATSWLSENQLSEYKEFSNLIFE